jgi:pimeloyl-ACP methyl ester carboxylesterase
LEWRTGNNLPKGIGLNLFSKCLKPLAETYTITMLSRRSGLEEGYTTQNMSDDYADLIWDEFGGQVDLIIGTSYGGMIAQHFAADHPELCQRVVLLMAAHKISSPGQQLDFKFCRVAQYE